MKTLAILITGLLMMSPSLYAKKHKNHKMNKEVFKQLNLSESQRKQLNEFRESNKGTMKALKEEKRAAKKAMDAALIADTSDSQLRILHNKISAIKSKMKDQKFEKMLSTRNILKPEQRKKFYELRKQNRKKRKDKY